MVPEETGLRGSRAGPVRRASLGCRAAAQRRRQTARGFFDAESLSDTAGAIFRQLLFAAGQLPVAVDVFVGQQSPATFFDDGDAIHGVLKIVLFNPAEVGSHLIFNLQQVLFDGAEVIFITLHGCRMQAGFFRAVDFGDGSFADGLFGTHSIPSDAAEEGQQAVVVALRQRIDFMIVTAGTVDGQAQHGLAGGGDDVVHVVIKASSGSAGSSSQRPSR